MRIEDIIDSGCSLDYKDLVLCDLSKYSAGRQNCQRRFQVYSTEFKEIYSSQKEAIDKFCELLAKKVKEGPVEFLQVEALEFVNAKKENRTVVLRKVK